MKKYLDARETARRQHRALGLYAALYCWVRKLDGVAVERRTIERLLGLNRIRRERVAALMADLRGLFPFREMIPYRGSLDSLFLARVPLDGMPGGKLLTEARVARFSDGTRIEVLRIWEAPYADDEVDQELSALEPFLKLLKNTDERLLTSYLALVSSGQIAVSEVPGISLK